MRKILFIILIILLIVMSGFIIAKGFEIGKLDIWGVKSIIAKNDSIDQKNSELSNLVSVTYPETLSELNTSAETLTTTKKEYENKAVLVSDSSYYMQTEKYEIEFLWTKLGNYAKDRKVQIKIDVTNSTTSGLYDLNFTVAGKYSNVTDFIYDIENDSKLGFKIEDFHMSATEGGVQGTFSCKEIDIKIDKIEVNQQNTDENTENTDNTTDTTNTTETNNTVNESNTTATDGNTTDETNVTAP